MKKLLDHLATIRTLSRTQTRLEELTGEEEWPVAISLLFGKVVKDLERESNPSISRMH